MSDTDKKVLVSIIMPVHDTGKYLEVALDNLLSQKYDGYELILVDDGSQEAETLRIIDKFDLIYNNMRVIHMTTSKGAAEARNTGLAIASGEYVIFLDSDDIFSENLVYKLYSAAKKSSADIVICNTGILSKGNDVGIPHGIPDGIFSLKKLGETGLVDCGLMPWNKLVRRELLESNGITFQNLPSCNDVYYSCKALMSAHRIIYLDSEALVFWRDSREGQISTRRNPVNLYVAVQKLLEEIDDVVYRKQLFYLLLIHGVAELRESGDIEGAKDFYINVNEFMMNFGESLNLDSDKGNMLVRLYKTFVFETEWWKSENLYIAELNIYKEDIVRIFKNQSEFIMWGCGKRGKAFLEFCMRMGIQQPKVYDKKIEEAIKLANKYEVEVATLDDLFSDGIMILATNDVIYRELMNEKIDGNILNLGDYCIDI